MVSLLGCPSIIAVDFWHPAPLVLIPQALLCTPLCTFFVSYSKIALLLKDIKHTRCLDLAYGLLLRLLHIWHSPFAACRFSLISHSLVLLSPYGFGYQENGGGSPSTTLLGGLLCFSHFDGFRNRGKD